MARISFRRDKKADATIELRLGMTFLWGFWGIFVIAPILWNTDYLFIRLVAIKCFSFDVMVPSFHIANNDEKILQKNNTQRELNAHLSCLQTCAILQNESQNYLPISILTKMVRRQKTFVFIDSSSFLLDSFLSFKYFNVH